MWRTGAPGRPLLIALALPASSQSQPPVQHEEMRGSAKHSWTFEQGATTQLTSAMPCQDTVLVKGPVHLIDTHRRILGSMHIDAY